MHLSTAFLKMDSNVKGDGDCDDEEDDVCMLDLDNVLLRVLMSLCSCEQELAENDDVDFI